MSGIGEALLISAAASLITAGVTYALTPTQKIQGNRLNDLTSTTSSYGSPLPWAWGTVRLPGNKIWLDYLEETRRKEKQGKVETTFFDYYGYYASMYCDCPFRPIVDYQRIWMNKKLIYSQVGDAETIAEGGKFAEQYLRFYKGEAAQQIDPLLANKDPISNYSYGLPSDPDERDAYLKTFGIDPNTVILTPAYNQRAYMVAQRIPLTDFFNALPRDEAEIIASSDCTVATIVGDIFSLYFESDRYDVSLLTTPVKGFSVDTVEAAKSAIQSLQQAYFFDIVDSNGVYKFIPLNHPRDVVNLRIEDLAAHTGTQAPPKFEITEADPSSLPSQIIVKYIDPDLNYDVNEQRSTLEVKSHYNPNPVTLSFNLVLSPNDAATIADRALILAWVQKLTYSFKLPPSYLTLEVADLVPNLFDDRDYPIKITQVRLGANLIIECEGTAHDIYFWNLVRTLEEGGVTLGVADYNVSIVTNGRVESVADTAGNTYTEGVDYTLNNEGVTIIQSGNIPEGTELVVTTTATPTVPADAIAKIKSAGDTELLVLDIPLIQNEDEDYTIYFTAGGGDNWDGANIYFSSDNSRYTFVTNIKNAGIYGLVTDIQNETDNLVVSVNAPGLESVTDSDLNLGLNMALAGNKIIQFKTAELSGVDTYRLSDLTSGLRGTEQENDPAVGDRFVLLTGDAAVVAEIIMRESDIGAVRYFKAVSSRQVLAEVEPIEITYNAISMRPYAPVNIEATKNGVGDITITWDRRDRHSSKKNPPILSEEDEKYVINYLTQGEDAGDDKGLVRMFSSSPRVVREKTRTQQTNKNSSIYTADEQKSDFSNVASTITVEIAQVSSVFGNGSFTTATITPARVEPPPTFASFTPTSATVGATVGITGNNLATVNRVEIDGIVQNNLAVLNNSEMSFVISPPSSSGLITVYTLGGSAVSTNALIIENFKSKNTLVFGDRALSSADNNRILDCQSNGVIVLTLDKTKVSSGFQTTVRKKGTGDIILQIVEGDTLEAVGNKIVKQYTAAYVSYFGSGVWIALGAIE